MIFTETRLPGAYVLDLEPRTDSRGFFARVYCREEFAAHGLDPGISQANLAFNHQKGTTRGMHFQYPPDADSKLVRCTRGAVLDIIVDLRPESATYLEHVAVELSEDNRRALFVPERFAHGYQTLRENTEVMYHAGAPYSPDSEAGLRHDDPRLGIAWPLPVSQISARDVAYLLLGQVEAELRKRMTVSDRG